MNNHRTELRRALLTSTFWDKKQTNMFLFLKGGEKIMEKKNFLSGGLTLAAIAIVVAAMFVFLPKNTETAYAAQIAQKSYKAVAELSADEQQALNHKFSASAKDLLQKAKNAKDLKVLTYEQFVNTNPVPALPTDAETSTGKPGEKLADLNTLKFLQFTDEDGSIVILGVDPKTDLPVFVNIQKQDGKSTQGQKDGVGFEAGNGGKDGKATRVGTGNPEAGTSGSNFRTSNGGVGVQNTDGTESAPAE